MEPRRRDPRSHSACVVDFDNDSAGTAIAVADALGDDLWGVRLDTSESLVDRALADLGDAAPRGAARREPRARPARARGPRRRRSRTRADRRLRRPRCRPDRGVRDAGAPVDAYGVGSSLLRGENNFTADIVRVDGRPLAKHGRGERPNPRLELVG